MNVPVRFRWPSFLWMALLAAAHLCACTSLGVMTRGYLDIEQAQLQSPIATRFPAHYCKTVLFCVELSKPQVTLDEGEDRINLAVEIRIVVGTRERTGHLGLAGRPRYVPSQGQLFLDDLEVTRLEMVDLPDEYAEWVRIGATLEARRVLQAHAIYTLDDSTAKGTFAKRTISDVRVVNGKLRVTFGGGAL